MYKINLSVVFLFIIFSGCQNRIMISQLEIIDDRAYYSGDKFSGIAIKKDADDNIRVEEKYNDGVKFYTKLFYTEGSMQSEWVYGTEKISVTRFYKSGKVESKENVCNAKFKNLSGWINKNDVWGC